MYNAVNQNALFGPGYLDIIEVPGVEKIDLSHLTTNSYFMCLCWHKIETRIEVKHHIYIYHWAKLMVAYFFGHFLIFNQGYVKD